MVQIMRPETALRRMKKRASEFYGMTFGRYIEQMTYMDGDRIVLNDSIAMQKCFIVWCAQPNQTWMEVMGDGATVSNESILRSFHESKNA